jgi:hypothetical protein
MIAPRICFTPAHQARRRALTCASRSPDGNPADFRLPEPFPANTVSSVIGLTNSSAACGEISS